MVTQARPVFQCHQHLEARLEAYQGVWLFDFTMLEQIRAHRLALLDRGSLSKEDHARESGDGDLMDIETDDPSTARGLNLDVKVKKLSGQITTRKGRRTSEEAMPFIVQSQEDVERESSRVPVETTETYESTEV